MGVFLFSIRAMALLLKNYKEFRMILIQAWRQSSAMLKATLVYVAQFVAYFVLQKVADLAIYFI